MVYVEDLLKGLGLLVATGSITYSWRTNFINNVSQHVDNGKSLSTSQGDIILKVAGNHQSSIAQIIKVQATDVQYAINHPIFKRVPFVSANIKREVRYVGSNKLAFRFKLDPIVVNEIKALRVQHSFVDSSSSFNEEFRVWIVSVDSSNLTKIQEVIKKHKFDFDEAVLEYITRCANSKQVKSTFVLDPDDNVIYANVCNNPLLAYAITEIMKGEQI